MLDRFFKLSEHGTNVRTELLAGLTTFLTMAYIIFLQPAVLLRATFRARAGGKLLGFRCGDDRHVFDRGLVDHPMGLYARYPIALAPGMGENFILVLTVIPAAAAMIARETAAGTMAPGETTPWQIALGVVFIAGVLFLAISLCGVQTALLNAISPSMRSAIAVGIGLFIAFIGLQGAGLVVADPDQCVKMNPNIASPDLMVFFFGLLVTAALHARRVRGSIVWGIVASTLLALALCHWMEPESDALDFQEAAESKLQTRFAFAAEEFKAEGPISRPPSMAPTLLKMDLVGALSGPMLPFILIFLFMDLFDTLGTLVAVGEQAGFIKDNQLPRAREALVCDAIGTVAGAACGTSTVTSFIESTAGVEQGGRTGLTALVVAFLFLTALFFAPLIKMIGSYPSITAPALVVVGTMMMRNVTKIDWANYAEAMPAFITFLGIPLTYSIADGLALGFVSYPVVKLAAGQGRDVKWLMVVLALVLVAYLACVRCRVG